MASTLGSKLGYEAMARIAPVFGLSATTAPGLPRVLSAFQAASCALELTVTWTVAPLVVFPVTRSMTFLTSSEESLPDSSEFFAASMPVAPKIV